MSLQHHPLAVVPCGIGLGVVQQTRLDEEGFSRGGGNGRGRGRGGVNIGGDGEHGRVEAVGGRVSKVSGGRGRG